MIEYLSGSFGLRILFRFHGSAVFKSLTPAVLSSIIYLILFYTADLHSDPRSEQILEHPYTMGALIAALTFLLAFRANFSYNRYWESFTALHQMHSKWMDCAMELSAFHLQSKPYDSKKPPSFADYPDLVHAGAIRERERKNEPSMDELKRQLDEIVESPDTPEPSLRHRVQKAYKTEDNEDIEKNNGSEVRKSINASSSHNTLIPSTSVAAYSQAWDHPHHPPLFLQEGAHLMSLLSAVAMSTLRNDVEGTESPLAVFKPGAPWPHVDPDAYSADVRQEWAFHSTHRSVTVARYLLGTSRTGTARALYNHARPFRVLGGVSDAEVELLQAARGPQAKVALCFFWLQEFMTREYLAGSFGDVSPTILSRLFQFASDGMVGYNQARKIAYIPFPFPHAQITSLFVLIVLGFMPVLMLSFTENEWMGFILNLFTVMCFTGLHEVARELENPFSNVPNDVPLNNFQAQFNESLMVMFAGYHPDFFWEQVSMDEDSDENKQDAQQGGAKSSSPVRSKVVSRGRP